MGDVDDERKDDVSQGSKMSKMAKGMKSITNVNMKESKKMA